MRRPVALLAGLLAAGAILRALRRKRPTYSETIRQEPGLLGYWPLGVPVPEEKVLPMCGAIGFNEEGQRLFCIAPLGHGPDAATYRVIQEG